MPEDVEMPVPKPSETVDRVLQNYQVLIALAGMTLGEALVKAYELGHIEGQIHANEIFKTRLEAVQAIGGTKL